MYRRELEIEERILSNVNIVDEKSLQLLKSLGLRMDGES